MNSDATFSDQIIIKNDQIVLREEFDDWALLFDPNSGIVCGLNPVGVLVCKLIDGKRSIADVITAVKSECSDAPDSVNDDVSAFISDICEKGYAKRADTPVS